MLMDIRKGAFFILAPRLLMPVTMVNIMSEWIMVMMIEMGQLEAVEMRHAYDLAHGKCQRSGYSQKPSQRGC